MTTLPDWKAIALRRCERLAYLLVLAISLLCAAVGAFAQSCTSDWTVTATVPHAAGPYSVPFVASGCMSLNAWLGQYGYHSDDCTDTATTFDGSDVEGGGVTWFYHGERTCPIVTPGPPLPAGLSPHELWLGYALLLAMVLGVVFKGAWS